MPAPWRAGGSSRRTRAAWPGRARRPGPDTGGSTSTTRVRPARRLRAARMRDACAHGVARPGITLQAERVGESDHVLRLGIEAVVELGRCLRQTASANVEDIGVEAAAERSPTKPQVTAGLVMPGSRMITASRPARAPCAAVAQVMLADAVGADVGAIQKSAHGVRIPVNAFNRVSRRRTAAHPRPARPARVERFSMA